MSEDSSPISGAMTELLTGQPLEKALDIVLDSKCVEIAAEKLLALLRDLGVVLSSALVKALDRAGEVTCYFRDRKSHTGVVTIAKGQVVASLTVAVEDAGEGIRRAMRDLGIGGPQSSGSTSSFSSSGPFRPPPPPSSAPHTSSGYAPPPGRSPAPLVRRDALWPHDPDEDESDPEDYLPGWSR